MLCNACMYIKYVQCDKVIDLQLQSGWRVVILLCTGISLLQLKSM